MTNEEIVLSNMRKFGDVNPLMFGAPKRQEYADSYYYEISLDKFSSKVNKIIKLDDINDRVYNIAICGIRTFTEDGGYQCAGSCRRSTIDIWRIYKHYFGEIEIFPIMRALHYLVVNNNDFKTYRCPDIRRRVFWLDSYFGGEKDMDVLAELGVAIKDWEHIGEPVNGNVL